MDTCDADYCCNDVFLGTEFCLTDGTVKSDIQICLDGFVDTKHTCFNDAVCTADDASCLEDVCLKSLDNNTINITDPICDNEGDVFETA